ncbi:MAG TPA: Ig-like domain repeat protein [Gaiellaceae bacterium]|nr:Ig-like domain repeat protein [Gaiellaceae bacterium]
MATILARVGSTALRDQVEQTRYRMGLASLVTAIVAAAALALGAPGYVSACIDAIGSTTSSAWQSTSSPGHTDGPDHGYGQKETQESLLADANPASGVIAPGQTLSIVAMDEQPFTGSSASVTLDGTSLSATITSTSGQPAHYVHDAGGSKSAKYQILITFTLPGTLSSGTHSIVVTVHDGDGDYDTWTWGTTCKNGYGGGGGGGDDGGSHNGGQGHAESLLADPNPAPGSKVTPGQVLTIVAMDEKPFDGRCGTATLDGAPLPVSVSATSGKPANYVDNFGGSKGSQYQLLLTMTLPSALASGNHTVVVTCIDGEGDTDQWSWPLVTPGSGGATGTTVPWTGLGSENVWGGQCKTPTAKFDELNPPSGQVGWLFVLNGVGTTTGWTVTAHFSGGVTAVTGPTLVDHSNLHFVVYAPAAAQLLDATATNPSVTTYNNFTLSHCGGGSGNSNGGNGGGHPESLLADPNPPAGSTVTSGQTITIVALDEKPFDGRCGTATLDGNGIPVIVTPTSGWGQNYVDSNGGSKGNQYQLLLSITLPTLANGNHTVVVSCTDGEGDTDQWSWPLVSGGSSGGGGGGGGQCDDGSHHDSGWNDGDHNGGHNDGDHDGDDDDCGGSGGGQYGHGIPICHRTGSKKNPWVLLVVPQSDIPQYAAHGDIIPAPASGCPKGDGGDGGGHDDDGHHEGKHVEIDVGYDHGSVHLGDDDHFTIHVKSDDGDIPGGVISCSDNGETFDSASLVHGAGDCTQTFSESGDHRITVTFVPSNPTLYQWGSDDGTTVSCAKLSSVVGVTTNSPQVTEGDSVTLTAALTGTGATPGGTIQFYDGSNPLGQVGVDSHGSATFSTSSLGPGSHSISAVYSGDSSYDGATGYATQIVNKLVKPTTTALVSSGSPSAAGQPVTFTTTVSGSGGTPSGSAALTVDGSQVASVNLDSNGRAAFTVASLAPGSHAIAVAYSPASGTPWTASSASLSQTVNKYATATAVTVSDSTPVIGANVTLTATVTSGGKAVTDGTVTFKVDGAAKATVGVNGSGVATTTTSWSSTGGSTVTAVYNGTASNDTSTGTAAVTVKRYASTTALSVSDSTPTIGENVTLTATVKSGSSVVKEGSVTFKVDGVTKATVNVSPSGVASTTASWTAAGTGAVEADYNGTSTYDTSSATQSLTVSKIATATALSSSDSSATLNQSVTFTAKVTAGGANMTSGTVTFSVDGATVGSPSVNSAGVATYSTSSLAAGSHTIKATYSGTSTYSDSNSSLTETVSKLTTAGSLTTSDPSPTSRESVTFTFTPKYGSTSLTSGTVTFTVDGTTQTVSLNGHGQATFTYSNWSRGNHTVTASYNGDSTYAGCSDSQTETGH